jgi:hypothetical protein
LQDTKMLDGWAIMCQKVPVRFKNHSW